MDTTTAHHVRNPDPAVNGHDNDARYANVAPLPAGDPETRLEMSRARLRHRLLEDRVGDQTGVWEHINEVTRQVAPVARQYVRANPVATLAGAALVGALLARFKPWRALGGPLLLGMIARQLVLAAMSRSNQILGALVTGMSRPKRGSPTQHL